jgi:hypothetical protein
MYTHDFLPSHEYKVWRQANPDKKKISLSTFMKAKCKCMKDARMHTCSDECETELLELLEVADKLRRRSLHTCTCEHCIAWRNDVAAAKVARNGVGIPNGATPSPPTTPVHPTTPTVATATYDVHQLTPPCGIIPPPPHTAETSPPPLLFPDGTIPTTPPSTPEAPTTRAPQHPLSGIYPFMSHVLCEGVLFPVTGSTKKLYQKKCCFADKMQNCAECDERLDIDPLFKCPTLWDEAVEAKWRHYEDKVQPKGYTTRVLAVVTGNRKMLKEKILEQFHKYRKHHWAYRWLDTVRMNDRETLQPGDIFIQTDYAAQVELSGQHTPCCGHSGVANLSCWAVLHSAKEVFVPDENGVMHSTIATKCDHIRVVSPASGRKKDQDWFLHGKTLQEILEYYIKELGAENVLRIILWTDGAPTQYKCRQNFCYIANFPIPGIIAIHRFGATSQFKGVHDKIGQTSVRCIRKKEEASDINTRCTTAYEWYAAVKREMPSPSVSTYTEQLIITNMHILPYMHIYIHTYIHTYIPAYIYQYPLG